MNQAEATEWQERLRRVASESLRLRAARPAARRESAERRRRGMELRQAWRQARLDARQLTPSSSLRPGHDQADDGEKEKLPGER